MPKRRLILPLLGCGLVAIALCAVLSQTSRPSYHSRPLRYWVATLAQARVNEPGFEEATAAINSAGTNALPLLLKWIQYEPQPWRTTLADVLARLSRSAPQRPAPPAPRERLANGAGTALWILGMRALPALPELTRMMNDPARPTTAVRATSVLRAFGTNSLPALLAVVDTPKHPCRLTAIMTVYVMHSRFGSALEPAVPHLIQCLKEASDPNVPSWAARSLAQFKSAPHLVAPALADCLGSPNKHLRLHCAKGLAGMGAPAASALPVLTNALADQDPEVGRAASNAIFTIAAALLTNAPPN